ncbi:GntR family transcriptional regulator [Sporosarcina pasteurii]|nr:GntR family transcriptional regulator [Sporosarcina pasteurii]MDS9472473.1 GntR family transcriptional regulator [Sporosarcina pasteurii]
MKFPANWLTSDSLGELISSELRFQIINGEIEDGAVLSENMISKSFETSRSPVREAFKTLELEGLVTPGRMGITVQGLNEEDIKEIYDVRFLLEGFSIRKIFEGFDSEEASEFYKIVDLMKLHADHNDFMEFAFQDLLFHETLIMRANHKRVSYFWRNIRNIILCLLVVATEKRFKEVKEELDNLIFRHRILIDALVEKDQNKIEKWLEDHLLDTNATVMSAYLKK